MRYGLNRLAVLLVSALFVLGGANAFAETPARAKKGEQCGTIRGISCEKGLWCDLQEGACNGADLGGICVARGDVCAEIHAPVCGCNGKTYSNDCKRINKRVQKNHVGECTSDKNQTRPNQTKPNQTRPSGQ